MSKMLGRIIQYNGEIGKILSEDDEYMFSKQDLLNDIKIGDLVVFRNEIKFDIKRAYFVKKLDYK